MNPLFEPFLRAIAAAPGDPGPRLQFADFLAEQGLAEAAEYVRLRTTEGYRDSGRQAELLAYLGGEVFAPPWYTTEQCSNPDDYNQITETGIYLSVAPADPVLRRVFGVGREERFVFRVRTA